MEDRYQRFVDRFLNADSLERRDGPPIELLDDLDPDELDRAESDLLARLSAWRDDWPIIALGHIRSEKAAPLLYSLLSRSFGSMKAQIATAIWKICGDEKMLSIVIKQSRPSLLYSLNPFFEFKQIDIIYCLAEFPQPAAESRLKELTRSRHYLVSYNAKRALGLIRDVDIST